MGRIEVDDVLAQAIANSKQAEQEREDAKKKRGHLISLIFFFAFLLIAIFIYLSLPCSKVKNIVIDGESYYSNNKIIDLLNIDYNTPAIFISKGYCEKKALEDPLIESIDIDIDKSRNVHISIKMKKAVGYYWNDNNLYILLANGDSIEMSTNMYDSLLSLPLISDDLSDEMMTTLANEMAKLDSKVISQISEIWRYKTSYDQRMYRFLMNDGNQTFMSSDSIVAMNTYFDIITSDKHGKKCLMLDSSKYSYSTSCEEIDMTLQQYINRVELVKIINNSINSKIFAIIKKLGG